MHSLMTTEKLSPDLLSSGILHTSSSDLLDEIDKVLDCFNTSDYESFNSIFKVRTEIEHNSLLIDRDVMTREYYTAMVAKIVSEI